MRTITKSISVLCAGVLLAACQQGGGEVAPDISFTSESAALASSGVSADAAGGDFSLKFKSAADWHIAYPEGTKALASWVVVTPPAGKGGDIDAVITIIPNVATEQRSTTLLLVSGNISKEIPIRQEARSLVPVTTLALSQNACELYPGESAEIVASVLPTFADGDKTVSWKSSAPGVATVADGLVTAVAEGSATITASVGSLSAVCTVTVLHVDVPEPVVEVESITLSAEELKLTVGESAALTATVNPSNATDQTLVWSSSDPGVATVSGGTVTAVGLGSATITVTAGGKSASCTVTVKHSGNSGEDLDDPIDVNPW